MQFGDRYTVIARMQSGIVKWPVVISGSPVLTTVERADGSKTKVYQADTIGLRTDREGNTFLKENPESSAFMAPRFTSIVGLDVDEQGKPLSFVDLSTLIEAQIEQRQLDFIAAAEIDLDAPGATDADGLPN